MILKEKRFQNEFNFTQFSAYLEKYRWINEGKYNGIFTIWHRPEIEFEEYELIIPENKSIKKLEVTLEKALITLATFYNKSVSQIIDDYNSSSRDKVKLQIKSEMTRDGLIPLNEGLRLLDNAKELITASFLAVNKKKKNFIGQRPESVTRVLENVELGQTEEGSYVLNVFVPRDYFEDLEIPLIEEKSFTRKALDVLVDASSKIVQKAEFYQNNPDITIFDETVVSGVSSNLCNAIAEISSGGKSDVLIEIEYNNGLDSENEQKKIFINKDLIPTIKLVTDYFKKDLSQDDYYLRGFVTKLHQEIGEADGEITLTAIIEGKLKRVGMILDPEQYVVAQQAHREKKQVVCKGTLNIQDRRTYLYNVTSVLLSEEE